MEAQAQRQLTSEVAAEIQVRCVCVWEPKGNALHLRDSGHLRNKDEGDLRLFLFNNSLTPLTRLDAHAACAGHKDGPGAAELGASKRQVGSAKAVPLVPGQFSSIVARYQRQQRELQKARAWRLP